MENLAEAVGWVLTGGATAITATWWLSRQFSSIRDLIHSKISQTEKIILDKLEYHERHDDQRFSDLHNQIWEMKILQAAHNGSPVPSMTNKKRTTSSEKTF